VRKRKMVKVNEGRRHRECASHDRMRAVRAARRAHVAPVIPII
jgi:hypothetical protein